MTTVESATVVQDENNNNNDDSKIAHKLKASIAAMIKMEAQIKKQADELQQQREEMDVLRNNSDQFINKSNTVDAENSNVSIVDGPVEKQVKDGVASELFAAPIATSRPTGVYLEQKSGKYVIWYYTENGEELGREPITKRNEKLMQDVQIGYNFTIAATPDNLNKISEKAFFGTRYYIKDGRHRSASTLPQFQKLIKN